MSNRSWALWYLGYPEAAVADVRRALQDAREIGQAGTLMYALTHTSLLHMHCGNYPTASAQLAEVAALADGRGASFWRTHAMMHEGCVLSLNGNPSNGAQLAAAGIAAYRSTGSKAWLPWSLSNLARAYTEMGQLDDAWRCIGEAMTALETTKETWPAAEVHRVAGEIVLKAPQRDVAKAESCFECALAVARSQQAKSWELRAAASLARLWRDQGRRDDARHLLAPVYDWFTEGFDTLDLKEAKALLDALAS